MLKAGLAEEQPHRCCKPAFEASLREALWGEGRAARSRAGRQYEDTTRVGGLPAPLRTLACAQGAKSGRVQAATGPRAKACPGAARQRRVASCTLQRWLLARSNPAPWLAAAGEAARRVCTPRQAPGQQRVAAPSWPIRPGGARGRRRAGGHGGPTERRASQAHSTVPSRILTATRTCAPRTPPGARRALCVASIETHPSICQSDRLLTTRATRRRQACEGRATQPAQQRCASSERGKRRSPPPPRAGGGRAG